MLHILQNLLRSNKETYFGFSKSHNKVLGSLLANGLLIDICGLYQLHITYSATSKLLMAQHKI